MTFLNADRTMKTIISIRNISINFGNLRALDGVDIDIENGVCTGLIGPNGSGKSTLLNCLSGILKPSSGEIVFHERNITNWTVQRRANFGLMRNFQNLRLFDDLSIRENIAVAGFINNSGSGFDEQAISNVARRFGLENDLGDRVGDLSWGHRRRVELARVFHATPKFMLLDEPGAGLDITERSRLPGLIGQMSDIGVGTLLIDHDIGLIRKICSRVLVLREGRLIFDGTPQQAFSDPVVRDCYLGKKYGLVPS